MNVLLEVVMKLIISSIFPVLAALLSIPSFAQTLRIDPVSDIFPLAMTQYIPSVVYKNAAAENQLAGVDTIPGFGNGTNASLNVKIFRVDVLGMTNSRINMFSRNDRASFTANAPMPIVNRTLCFVGTVFQTQLDSSVTKWIQVLSLVATQRINASFTYSAKIDKYSSFDSVMTYRLHPATDLGRTDVVASFQYRIKF
jgi:hypothetical protein